MIYNKLVCLVLMMVSVLSLNAQNLIASATPIDVKTKKIDSVMIKSILERESNKYVSSLYDGWKNERVNLTCVIPDSYDIDLRGFTMPTTSKLITSPYGERWGRIHKGVDIKVYTGDTIRSAFDGKVRIVKYDANGYGNYVVIRHSNGLETVYAHLSKHIVKENQYVKSGEPIGLGGNTGRSTGSHLHFETRLCGLALNPSLMFDFKMQDVTNDFYHFDKSKHSSHRLTTTLAQRNTKKKR